MVFQESMELPQGFSQVIFRLGRGNIIPKDICDSVTMMRPLLMNEQINQWSRISRRRRAPKVFTVIQTFSARNERVSCKP